jgi:hypothetical protein
MVVENASVAADQDQVVFLDLAFAPPAPRLHDGLGERGEPPHVVGREFSSARVGRQRSTRAKLAVLHKGSSFAFGTKAVILQCDQHRVGIAVVEFADVDVLQFDC